MKTARMNFAGVGACLGLLAVSACTNPRAFGSTFPDNRSADVAAVLARIEANPRPRQRSVVVGATAAPHHVFAFDLDENRLLWKQAAAITTAPLAAGDYVVTPEARRITLRDLATGEVRVEVPTDGMALMGADSDGHVTAVVLSTGGSMGARSRLLVVRDGELLLDERVDKPLGGPAVVAGLVFLPWNRIFLSVLEPDGAEVVRVRIHDDVASQAIVHDNQVFFGSAGLFRFDARVTAGGREGATYYRTSRGDRLPANPDFLPSSSERPLPASSAVHRVSLSWSPVTSGPRLALADDNLYLAFYRQIFALDPDGPGVRWVHQTTRDAVGVEALPNTVLIADETGAVTVLDGQGRVRSATQLGVPPIVARFRVDSFDRGAAAGDAPASLLTQLVAAATDPDARLVPARTLAVTLLAALEDEQATTALIEICQDRAGPDRVRHVACVALSKRENGSEAVIEALSRHANYLTGAKAPPVGPLSEAALRTGDARAVPYLLAHLEDPETAIDELAPLLLALKGLADASAAQPIADFLRLYHADASDGRMQGALVVALQALVKLQPSEASTVLEPVANDGLGEPIVRAEAARLLATLSEAEAPAASPAAGPRAEPVAATGDDTAPPARLTVEQVRKALKPVEEKLGLCIRNDPRRPLTARLTVVIDGEDGSVLAVQTLPPSLLECVQPLVLSVPFPATRYGKRETVTYTMTR